MKIKKQSSIESVCDSCKPFEMVRPQMVSHPCFNNIQLLLQQLLFTSLFLSFQSNLFYDFSKEIVNMKLI